MARTKCHMTMSLDGFFAVGAIDELSLDLVPALFKREEGLADGVVDHGFEPIEVIHSPHATHVRYQIAR
jgi:hypothetical protein